MSKRLSAAKKPLSGTLSFPGDKSIAHRAFILGTLAKGTLRLENVPASRDVFSTRECMESMGAQIDGMGTACRIEGLGLRGLKPPSGSLDCGNSGTTMRLLMGVLAGQPREAVLMGDASLSQRPMKRVAEPLSGMGADFTMAQGGRPPVRVRGTHPLKPVTVRLKIASAQVKSAILLAGLFAEGETTVIDPFGTRDHTERMLGFLSEGRALRRENGAVIVEPFLLKSGKRLEIPGDISSAAYFAAAATNVPGSELMLRRVLLNPTRLGFFDVLSEMGAALQIVQRGVCGGEPVGDIQVHASSLRGVTVSAEKIPALVDEVPLLSVLAATASGETRIEGLGELRIKETDRLAGTAEGLRALGADAEVLGDTLIVRGVSRLKGAPVKTHGDHRLAMAFSVAALAAEGTTEIDDPECVSISFPGFFDLLEGITR